MRSSMRRKSLGAVLATTAVAVGLTVPAGASAAPLPDNCTKVQGQVTCTTFDGPGMNRAGVGETTIVETQGNTTNVSPEPQDLDMSETCNPPTSQGTPCNP
jgi:hypothetical protein